MFCFIATTTWFIGTIITGDLSWRCNYNFIEIVIAIVLLVSIQRIRSIISSTKTMSKVESNKFLLNIYIASYIVQILFQVCLQTLSIVLVNYDKNNYKKQCRILLAFETSQIVKWLSNIACISLTSYMNIKFSKTQNQAN